MLVQPRSLFALVGATVISAIGLTGSLSAAGAYEALHTKSDLRGVYFLPIEDSKRVDVQLIIHAGESDATGPEGLAHYLEHLVHWQSVGNTDAKPLHHATNAYTNRTTTNYFARGRPEQLEKLIDQMAGVFVRPRQPSAFMLRERDVVVEEYNLRVAENIQRQLHTSLVRVLFDGHPLSRSVIGTPASIRRIRPTAALAFHDQFYNPSNATLIVTGDVERASLIRNIERRFGMISSKRAAARAWRQVNAWQQHFSIVSKEHKLARQPQAMVLQTLDTSGIPKTERMIALRIVGGLLNSALPGGLERALVYEDNLASRVFAHIQFGTHDTAILGFHASPAEGIQPDQVVKTYRELLSRLAANGISRKTLGRLAKRQIRQLRRTAENVDARARDAAHWISADAPPASVAAQIQALESIKPSLINQILSAIGRPRRTVVGYAMPEQGEPTQ